MPVHQQAMNKAMNTVFTFSGDVYADWQQLNDLLHSFNSGINARFPENRSSLVLYLSQNILNYIDELQTTWFPEAYKDNRIGGSIAAVVERIVAAFRAGPENLPLQVFVFGSYGEQFIRKKDVKNLREKGYKVLNPDVFFTINEKVFNENQIFYILNLADMQNAPVAFIADRAAAEGTKLLRF